MASKTFTDGELNYFRICYIVTRVVPEKLREFFKQQWNHFFKTTHGEWRDTRMNAKDFYKMESPRNRTRNARLLDVMKSGNTSKWDCTCLFYALLYSDSLGKSLKHSSAWTSVDALREIRNEVFAHTIDGSLEDVDFQATVQKVLTSFSTLNLDPLAVKDIKNQKSFLTEELSSVQQELETEKKRNAELFSFCVLPPKPSHDTTERLEEVSSIYEEMIKLRNAKKKETTVTYLSGNPGCGKSEIARQIGKKYDEAADEGADLRFVFTLNGFSLDTLLQSYTEFAGRLDCDQDCITSINTANDISKEEKIVQIRGFIATRIQTYSSWLIIVDNVVDLKSVFQYLPQAGEKTIGKGQILVTTQDSHSIPKSDSYTNHSSLSPGMTEEDSIALLCHVSGLESKDDDTLQVAKALDFQPLALACAAVYMRQICSTRNEAITWGKYLQKLQNDQREATEAAYEETSLAYRATMTTAVKLALEREVDKSEVMLHAFWFLSYVAPDPIPLKYVVQYVKTCIPKQDEDLLAAKISSSSLVIFSGDDSVEVRLHQVVYQCLQNVLNERNVSECDVYDVVLAFSDICSFDANKQVDIAETRKLVPHFKSIAATLQSLIEQDERPSFVRDSALCSKLILVAKTVPKISHACYIHGFYQASITLQNITFMIQQQTVNDENDPSLANILIRKGSCYLKIGQRNEARGHFERALDICKKVYGEEHPNVADCLNSLAMCLRHLRKYKEAKECAERSLAIIEKGPTHQSFSWSLRTLGSILCDMGHHNEARDHFERALDICKEYGEEEHLDVAVCLNNLAKCLRHSRKYKEAKECAERSLAIREKTLGPTHQYVAESLCTLGCILCDMGHHNEARDHFERALDICKKEYGEEEHLNVAVCLNYLAKCLHHSRKYKEAKECAERSLAIREKTLGPTNQSFDELLSEEELSNRKRMSLKRRNSSSSEPACSQTRSPTSLEASISCDNESLHQHIVRSEACYCDQSTNGGPPSERNTSSKKIRRM